MCDSFAPLRTELLLPSAPVDLKHIGKFTPAPVREVASLDECDFYHTVDMPGHGTIQGQWDLRGREATYLGDVNFEGKSVLEIGPASGHLSFWMEAQGARVTAFELGEDHKWDFVPFKGVDLVAHHASRKIHLRRLHNSWWFLRAALKARAQAIYGTVYDIEPSLGRFDVVTLNSILLHLRDPLRAIEQAASVCGETIIITDVAEEHIHQRIGWLRHLLSPVMKANHAASFIPRAARSGPIDAWFHMPSALVAEMLMILGFKTTITKHRHIFKGKAWKLYTVVGRRS